MPSKLISLQFTKAPSSMFLLSKSLENLTFFKEDNPSKANEETLQLPSKIISSIFLQLWKAHSPM